ncbi:MAG: winged helix family two component transcriptional regulator [Acidimicrobiales bacterium]|nr:winged helix family two component transcriptional regulator [Acidimicrobiales bacterium]
MPLARPVGGSGEEFEMRILVVEDEVELAAAIAVGLRREGYAVDVANDGHGAIDRLTVASYDLVTLDLNLPDGDGLELARRIRSDPLLAPIDGEPPPRILMVTARDAVGERVTGLDEGADDYLVKPFAFTELSARVRSLMRREAGRSGAVLTVGELVLDTARFEATRRGRLLDLTAKEFALLRYFMAHSGQVLSQERLLEHVWDENADPLTNTVRVTVGTLRRKLSRDDDREPPIETVIGAGYRLRADVLAEPSPPTADR